MVPTHWKEAIATLEEKTAAGRIEWMITDDPTVFSVVLDGRSISLDNYRMGPRILATVTLWDGEGEEVDNFELDSSDPDYARVKRLWDAARNKAKGIDIELQNVVGILEGL